MVLFLAGPRLLWAKGRQPLAYPQYEPPSITEEPSEPSPAVTQGEQAPEAPTVGGSADVDQAIAPAAPEPEPLAAPAPAEPAEPTAPAAAMEPPPMEEPRATPPAPPPVMKKYKVYIWQENGDCLWRIAQKLYGDKDKWRLIYMANRDIIKDPNKIYPKQRLKIPPPDWQP
jgi:nucleoid-associated protein YgaU